jgi:hypothetical protein|tara:strand:+ start:1012 stop:1242 length:231 start_codon:yes stop_codon:yes gene_type:complete
MEKGIVMNITEEQKERILNVWAFCKTGQAKTKEAKAELITLYNEIHKTRYKTTSNCSSCINTCYQGIKKLVNEIQM